MPIRTASRRDAPAIAEIYAPIVRESAISFEFDPPDEEEIAGRIARTLQTHPWLVAEDGSAILGYAYASQFRARVAYRWTCEVSAYVDPKARNAGIGRALYEQLLALLRRQKFHTALAIVTLPNAASIGFHESFGFEHAGVLREVGYKFARWHDVATLRLSLTEQSTPPLEPVPYSEIMHTNSGMS